MTNIPPRLSETVPTKFKNGKWVRVRVKNEVTLLTAGEAVRVGFDILTLEQRIIQLDGVLSALLPTSEAAKKVEEEVRELRRQLPGKPLLNGAHPTKPQVVPGVTSWDRAKLAYTIRQRQQAAPPIWGRSVVRNAGVTFRPPTKTPLGQPYRP